MTGYMVKLHLKGCLCVVIFVGSLGGQAYGGAKKAKEPVFVTVENDTSKSTVVRMEQPLDRAGGKSKPAAVPGNQADDLPKKLKQTPVWSKPENRKARRPVKTNRKALRKAVVKPSSDYMIHGILENPQRYDPRPNHRAAAVQDPQRFEIAQEHFLELDRNQDGKVDPVERAFSRLDMDRDLQHRQP